MDDINLVGSLDEYLQMDGKLQHLQHYNKTSESHEYQGVEHVVGAYNNLQHYNKVLDDHQSGATVNLLQHLHNELFIKKLSLQTAALCQMPVNTVFLNLLGIYSSVACRKWCVDYQYGGSLPIGLYIITEQPSGTGKSRVHRTIQAPFNAIKSKVIAEWEQNVKRLKAIEEPGDQQQAELQELLERKSAIKSRLFISNATPEGAEQTLLSTQGFLSAVSSEQGLLNSLLGLSYSKGENNNDLILNGFDGGHISSCRVSREGYHGAVIGGVILLAQQGSVEKVMGASNGVGLSERFLMLAEGHNLGKRDHLRKIQIDPLLETNLILTCDFARGIFENPLQIDDLLHLKISDSGHRLIAEYRNAIEPNLADGKRYSHVSLRGAASKINMQIMKIAANLHVMEREDDYNPTVPDVLVNAAIGIVHELLEANLQLCQDKGMIGIKAEFTAILQMFENNPRPQTERMIIQSRSRVSPFKDFTGNKSILIRDTLRELEQQKLLASFVVEDVKQYFLKQ